MCYIHLLITFTITILVDIYEYSYLKHKTFILLDFAIGAPYEGKGVVYIYTGFGILSGNTWWRKIQPETFNSFGFSLVPVPSTHEIGCNSTYAFKKCDFNNN